MNLYDVIKKFVIIEKLMVVFEVGKYIFEVDICVYKFLIK